MFDLKLNWIKELINYLTQKGNWVSEDLDWSSKKKAWPGTIKII
jgi:hypothetical protein